MSDYDIDKLNLIAETWASNAGKGEYSDEFYPAILADFKLVSIPEAYYRRSDEATINATRQQEEDGQYDLDEDDDSDESLGEDPGRDMDEAEESADESDEPEGKGKERGRTLISKRSMSIADSYEDRDSSDEAAKPSSRPAKRARG